MGHRNRPSDKTILVDCDHVMLVGRASTPALGKRVIAFRLPARCRLKNLEIAWRIIIQIACMVVSLAPGVLKLRTW